MTATPGATFLANLKELDRGALAVLRRSAGLRIAEARSAMGLFYRMLPPVRPGDEEIYFLVATLFPLNDQEFTGDFGATMRAVKRALDRDSIDRRMAILLDSEFERGSRSGGELPYRLRQAVQLAAGARVGVDWARLLEDLLQWNREGRPVQKRWARSYFQEHLTPDATQDHAEGGHP
ncbi:MAG: type I-E CRISPR-associated protein Cse2/CasB [Bacillota bacterium]